MKARVAGTWWDADSSVALASVAMIGCGLVVALGGLPEGRWLWVAVGSAAAATGLVVLMAADWIPALGVLVVSLPVPAVFSGETARVSPAAILTAAVLFAWLIHRASSGLRIDIGSAPAAAMVAILAAVTISAVFARHPLLAARELVNWLLLLGLLVAAADLVIERPGRMRSFLRIHAGVTGVVGVLAVSQMLGFIPGQFELGRTGLHRASLGFGQPNGLAMFLAISLPLSAYAVEEAETPGRKFLARAGLVACGLGLLATFSRGSWLALVCSTLIVFLLGERKWAGRVVLMAVGTAILVDIASGGAIVGRIAGAARDGMVIQRLALTFTGLLMFRANPIAGVGAGGFGEALEEYGPRVAVLSDYLGTAHNGYVHMAAETGTLGLAALAMLLGGAFRLLWRGARAAHLDPGVPAQQRRLQLSLLWSLSVFVLVGLFEWPFAHGIGQLAMLVVAGGAALERTRGIVSSSSGRPLGGASRLTPGRIT